METNDFKKYVTLTETEIAIILACISRCRTEITFFGKEFLSKMKNDMDCVCKKLVN